MQGPIGLSNLLCIQLSMEKSGARRQQISALLASLPPSEPGGGLIALLLPLRTQLASLVSEEGFGFLLERTIHQTAQSFRWIDAEPFSAGETRLDTLRATLALRTHEEALEASIFLLLNFVDLVASLIGDPLTVSIMRAAWGQHALGALGEDNQA
jgi:hypothetical protein